jgi:hypothetical protein
MLDRLKIRRIVKTIPPSTTYPNSPVHPLVNKTLLVFCLQSNGKLSGGNAAFEYLDNKQQKFWNFYRYLTW